MMPKIFPGAGYQLSAYDGLRREIQSILPDSQKSLCLAHSFDGARQLLSLPLAELIRECGDALVFYGVSLTSLQLAYLSVFKSILFISGTLDGVVPVSHFSLSRQLARIMPSAHTFVLISGASHHSIVNAIPSTFVLENGDLMSDQSSEEVCKIIAQLIGEFFFGLETALLDKIERATELIAAPIVTALQLEGSAALGILVCNSDYPTNPTCQYPIYPGESLPPGPVPAPSPPTPSNCICGSPWIVDVVNVMMGDLDNSPLKNYTIISNDAFHDVSDVHPFHLAHIFNKCDSNLENSCTLNITTVTMPIIKAGSLFPLNNTLSAFELRTKIKSRQAIWSAAGLGPGSADLDANSSICRDINQMAYVWALNNAEPSVRQVYSFIHNIGLFAIEIIIHL